jgi:hypothetical protein
MDFVQLLLIVLFIGSAVVALTFWNEIIFWVRNTLLPWIRKNLPGLENYVADAFVALDKVVVPIRNKFKVFHGVKEAWRTFRKYFLEILVQFQQKTPYEWVKQIIYWTICNLDSKEVLKTVQEQTVSSDSLPDSVRQEWLKQTKTTQDINVTQLRDRELELAMTH